MNQKGRLVDGEDNELSYTEKEAGDITDFDKVAVFDQSRNKIRSIQKTQYI